MVSSGLLRRVALVRTAFSEEPGTSFITVTKIGELGTTQAANSNRRTLRRRRQVLPKRRFLQQPHGVTTQKSPFFVVTSVKTSNLNNGFLEELNYVIEHFGENICILFKMIFIV
jgi:hypothetical protein